MRAPCWLLGLWLLAGIADAGAPVTVDDDCNATEEISDATRCGRLLSECIDGCASRCHDCWGPCRDCEPCLSRAKAGKGSEYDCVDSCSDCEGCRSTGRSCAAACVAADAECGAKEQKGRLTPASLAGKSTWELKLMRNEIFARRGYLFKTDLVFWHFKKEPWYRGDRKNVDALLDANDRANVEVLKKAEQERLRSDQAALPPALLEFWKKFQAAVAARDAKRLAALSTFPLEVEGTKLSEAELAPQVNTLLPFTALEWIEAAVPVAVGDACSTTTPPLAENATTGSRYHFRLGPGGWRWAGVQRLKP